MTLRPDPSLPARRNLRRPVSVPATAGHPVAVAGRGATSGGPILPFSGPDQPDLSGTCGPAGATPPRTSPPELRRPVRKFPASSGSGWDATCAVARGASCAPLGVPSAQAHTASSGRKLRPAPHRKLRCGMTSEGISMARTPPTPIDEKRRERGTRNDWPRAFWVRFYIDGRLTFGDRPYIVEADLTPGVALQETSVRLDQLLRGLIKAANVRKPAEVRTCSLELREWDNVTASHPDFVWGVTWDPERE